MYKIVGGDQKEYGPVSAQQIIDWIRQGRSNGRTLVRFEDGPWKPLSTFPEFAVELASAPGGSTPPPLSSAPPPYSAGGYQPGTLVGLPEVKTHLVFSIFVMLCCCLVPGIVALVYSIQAKSKQASGDIAGAQEAGNKAFIWCWVAVGIGLLTNGGFLIWHPRNFNFHF